MVRAESSTSRVFAASAAQAPDCKTVCEGRPGRSRLSASEKREQISRIAGCSRPATPPKPGQHAEPGKVPSVPAQVAAVPVAVVSV